MTTLFTRSVRPWRWLALMLLALPAVSGAQTVTGVGCRAVSIHDPVNGGTMPG
jgi:hypothetical protein